MELELKLFRLRLFNLVSRKQSTALNQNIVKSRALVFEYEFSNSSNGQTQTKFYNPPYLLCFGLTDQTKTQFT